MGNFGSNFLVDQSTRYDHNFYNQAGVDFDERWNSFYAPSNQEREEEVYEFLCDKQEYVFLHEDIQRGFIVNRHYIDKKYKIVSPVSNGLNSENKFRFCALIESLNIGKKRHAHRYCRPEASSNFCYEFTYRNDWEIII